VIFRELKEYGMSLKNFLPLRREVMEHWVYKDNDYFKVWVDMLFRARFSKEPKKEVYEGSLYTLEYGQFLFSRPKWSARLNISDHKLKKLLTLLIKEGMIEKTGRVGKSGATIYEIKNYEKYNNQDSQTPALTVATSDVDGNSRQPNTNQAPANNQPNTNQTPLKKNVKSLKSEEDNIIRLAVEYLNAITGKSYKYNTTKTVSCILARVNEGFTNIEDYKKVVDLKYKQWNGTENEIYIRPETLFGPKFEGYLQTAPNERQNSNWREQITTVERKI
jgi:uncharacterized phage protein (TIGR02220 family)